MDWLSILTTAITLLFGGGIGTLVTLRTTRKRAEFELLNEQLTKEMERNKELMQINIDKETRFQKQTDRLRECQDRELDLNKTVLRLTKEKGELDLLLATLRCEIHECPWRKPPTAATPPLPELDKDEWHKHHRKTTQK